MNITLHPLEATIDTFEDLVTAGHAVAAHQADQSVTEALRTHTFNCIDTDTHEFTPVTVEGGEVLVVLGALRQVARDQADPYVLSAADILARTPSPARVRAAEYCARVPLLRTFVAAT